MNSRSTFSGNAIAISPTHAPGILMPGCYSYSSFKLKPHENPTPKVSPYSLFSGTATYFDDRL
jgi:hypothetical protein